MKKILVLTTDQAISEVLKEKLSYFKFDVKTINNPDSTFFIIREYQPDLILIDFILQDNNGGAICHQIKCDPEMHKIPVIMLSDYPEFMVPTRKFGSSSLVIKPIDLSDLLFKVNESIGKNPDEALFASDKSRNHKSRLVQHW